ncbi:MAG: thiamine pyrophosphate-binding protein, partial [Brevibacterium sp.]
MSNSSAAAQQIARALVASSVTDVVIAPGSRSAPLIYALAPLAEAGLIRTHVRIDERDAGFLALGLARGLRAARDREAGAASGLGSNASGAVAIITTSGSAVANLHPAILEASYGRLPLIAITADRPARLRGTGANQTIDDQSQVLSDVRARFDVPALGGSDSLGGGKCGKVGDVETQLAEAVGRAVGEIGGVGQRASGPVQFNVQFDV